MFQREQLTIGDWVLYYTLMAVPVVNIIIFIILLFSKQVNKTLNNMLWTSVIFIGITLLLILTVLAPALKVFIEAISDLI